MLAIYKTIECHVDERGVATINLNKREGHNAFDEMMIVELTRCVSLLSSRSNVRVLVLTLAGKTFCADADINWMRRASEKEADENRVDAGRTRVGAREAKEMGLVHRICSAEALDAEVATVVGEMLANGPVTLHEIKQLFGAIATRPII